MLIHRYKYLTILSQFNSLTLNCERSTDIAKQVVHYQLPKSYLRLSSKHVELKIQLKLKIVGEVD